MSKNNSRGKSVTTKTLAYPTFFQTRLNDNLQSLARVHLNSNQLYQSFSRQMHIGVSLHSQRKTSSATSLRPPRIKTGNFSPIYKGEIYRLRRSSPRTAKDLSEQLNVNGHDSYRIFILRGEGLSRVHFPRCMQPVPSSSLFLLPFPSLFVKRSPCPLSKAVERAASWRREGKKKKKKKKRRTASANKRAKGKKREIYVCTVAQQRHLRGIPSGPSVFRFSERFGSTGQLRETVAPFSAWTDPSSPNDPRFFGELRSRPFKTRRNIDCTANFSLGHLLHGVQLGILVATPGHLCSGQNFCCIWISCYIGKMDRVYIVYFRQDRDLWISAMNLSLDISNLNIGIWMSRGTSGSRIKTPEGDVFLLFFSPAL